MRKELKMALTLEDVEKRLMTIEQEMKHLRQILEKKPAEETPVECSAPLWREAIANQPLISAAVEKAFQEMGITGPPVGHEKLQKMMEECGIRPENNEFSREIIAMRDE